MAFVVFGPNAATAAAGGSISTAFKRKFEIIFALFFYGNSRLFPTLFYAVRP